MAKPTGFIDYQRKNTSKRPINERIQDYAEIEQALSPEEIYEQAARCMDCGIPFCHTYGCPIHNLIPDFNEMIYRGHWERALEILHSTNNFPEFTGKVCPAPCEAACTLSLNMPAVNIKHIELQIVEKGWENGWIKPVISEYNSGKKVAVVGSGPAGLAAAQQLARAGHKVIVFEKADRIGGLLRYGIPDFKLDKRTIDRRLEQLEAEGIVFETNVTAGFDLSARYLARSFDAILIASGSTIPRDLMIPGRALNGIYFAMDYLKQNNQRVAGDKILANEIISAKDKHVVVIGGGDTGSDCIGTAKRQGAAAVTQIELMPKPPVERNTMSNPWPAWPIIERTSSSQEEGCDRLWSVNSLEFLGSNKQLASIVCNKLNWTKDQQGNMKFSALPNSNFELQADIVLLAMGFMHTYLGQLVSDNNLALDQRNNIIVDTNYMSSKKGIFVAGDAMSGASLVVRAIDHGRKAAAGIDKFLSKL